MLRIVIGMTESIEDEHLVHIIESATHVIDLHARQGPGRDPPGETSLSLRKPEGLETERLEKDSGWCLVSRAFEGDSVATSGQMHGHKNVVDPKIPSHDVAEKWIALSMCEGGRHYLMLINT